MADTQRNDSIEVTDTRDETADTRDETADTQCLNALLAQLYAGTTFQTARKIFDELSEPVVSHPVDSHITNMLRMAISRYREDTLLEVFWFLYARKILTDSLLCNDIMCESMRRCSIEIINILGDIVAKRVLAGNTDITTLVGVVIFIDCDVSASAQISQVAEVRKFYRHI